MFNTPLLGNGGCHGNRIWQQYHGGHVGNVMACDRRSFVQNGPFIEELQRFQHSAIWRSSAILNLNFVILDHPRSQLCGSISLWKIGVDPIFAVGDIAILWYCQFGWKVPNHAPFSGVFGGFEPLKIVGRHHNPQKAHPWVRTRHLRHKRLKSVQGCDLGAIARKKSITRTGQDRTTV